MVFGSPKKHTSIFGGAFGSEMLAIPIEAGEANVKGTALIDTGVEFALMTPRYAKACGIEVGGPSKYEVVGIGNQFKRVPYVPARIVLQPMKGAPLPLKGMFFIDDLPDGPDVLLGRTIVAMGVLTIHGPKGRWDWVVDRRKIEHFRVP